MRSTASSRLRYVTALLTSAAGVAALLLFPAFFHRTPFLPAAAVALVTLIVSGVGPAILAEGVILLATMFFALPPYRSFAIAEPGDLGRLVVFLALFGLADLLAWRLQRVRAAAEERERALRESETRYRHLLEQASDGIVLAAPDGRLVLVNHRACEMLGYTEPELLRQPLATLYDPGELDRTPLAWDELARTSYVLRERRLRRKDGSMFVAELSVRRTADGLAQAIVRDITERRRAEAALRTERDLLDGILATTEAGILVVTPEGRVVFTNPKAEAVLGITRELLADRTALPEGWRFLTPDGAPLPDAERPVRRVVATNQSVQDARVMLERPDGTRRVLSINASPLRDGAGAITAVVASMSDVTEQFGAQQALRDREEQLQRITAAVPGVVYQYVAGPGDEERFVFVSGRARELLGVSAEEILRDSQRAWTTMDSEDRRAMAVAFTKASERPGTWSFDFRVGGPGDPIRWLRDIATAVAARDPDRVIWTGVIVDITERRRLEEELLQSQKMESLGRLAGGVAHDFNNLLTVIRGYADVISWGLGEEDPRLGEVREIRRAADRATSLTRQLLAVSRRQVLVPREVDLNSLVQEMERMLRRVIGEHITIVTVPGPDLGWVRADAGQLEQVLLNLAVNARDAMPSGGTLTIETGRLLLAPGREEPWTHGVTPGDYVVLRVSDTGIGMDRKLQGKIFEPFFTTKPAGEGTGLGLSTVYGIVQQSSGAITVESEPGLGTSFRVFLPRSEARDGSLREPAPDRPPAPTGRPRAAVLLVEDDDGVRQLTIRMLEQYGFGVVEARSGAEALALLDGGGARVDAIVSDVVMPGMSGRELAGRLRLRRSELPVLFLSGYTGDEVLDELHSHPRQAFLQKPFSPDALVAALEELLTPGAGDPSLRSG